MDIDFPLILVVAVFITGAISLADLLYFSKQRASNVEALSAQGAGEDAIKDASSEPWLIENGKGFFPVLALVLLLRSFLVEPFQIPSGSMEPGLIKGDFILVNKFSYGFRLPVLGTKIIEMDDPARGDVMVFIPPHDPRYFIKRVIGLPGDTIRYIDKKVFINDTSVDLEALAKHPSRSMAKQIYKENDYLIQINPRSYGTGNGTWVVPEGHYFMLGDNRDNSGDSRVWRINNVPVSFVPDKNIVGKAFAIWMHWENFTDIPGFSRNKIID